MAGRDHMQIFPSRANQVLVKQRAAAALRGVNLLKRKRDAIDMKLRELRRGMEHRQDVADELLREAIFSFAKANFLNTDFNPMSVEKSHKAEAFVFKRSQKVVGITIPSLNLIIHPEATYPLMGLARGGSQVSNVRVLFQDVLKNLIAFASLEYAVRMLTKASHQNNMRVNALDYVVVPRLMNTVVYIRDELEEFEREDFYRLKKSQNKQLQAKAAFTALIKSKNKPDVGGKEVKKIEHPVADHAFSIQDFTKESILKRKQQSRLRSRTNSSFSNSISSRTVNSDKSSEASVIKELKRTLPPKKEERRPKPSKTDTANQTHFDDDIGTQTNSAMRH